MGLLSFLRRKTSPNNNRLDRNLGALKAQSYDATVAAEPPILGLYPVAGNGTTLLEEYQKSHPDISEVIIDTSAPPPIIPRVRSDSLQRPKTAPSNQLSTASPRPRAISQARSAKRQGPPYKLPPKIWSTPATEHQFIFTPPAPPFAHDRASSFASTSSRGFVDLLDAQSAIKPLDFQSRVKAAGARDYGEDVADRNIGENGHNLDSPEVHDYYFKNFGTIPTDTYESDEGGRPRQPLKRHSIGTALRTDFLVSSNHGAYPKRGGPHISEQHPTSGRALATPRKNRRNSLHSYVAMSSSMSGFGSAPGRRKFQESDIHRSNVVQQDDRDAYETNSDTATETSSPEKLSMSSKKNRAAVKHSQTQASKFRPRHRHNDSEQSTNSWEEIHAPTKHASRRQTMQYAPNQASANSASRRHSLQSIQSRSRQDLTRDRNPQKLTSLDESKSLEGVGLKHNPGPWAALQASPLSESSRAPSENKTLSRHRDDLNELVRRARAQSIASISSKDVKPSDIEEIVPERNSSLRNLSLTSETATYSSLSSNPFRPQSRHTPNTSIDLTPTVPFFKFTNPSQSTLVSMVNSSPRQGQTTRPAVATSPVASISTPPRQEPQAVVDLDEYASSDDSFGNPDKPCGENEKELLFTESDYCFNGSRLPGLPGLFEGSRPTTSHSSQMRRISAFHSPTNSMSDESDYESQPDLAENGRPFEPSIVHESGFSCTDSARADVSVRDESSDEEICFDIPRRRTGTVTYNPTPSKPRHGKAGSQIDVDREDKSARDISALIRLRRDKRTKRLESGPATRRIRSARKLNGANTDQSGYASDVEQS